MLETRGYAAQSKTSPLGPFSFQRRDVGPQDVLIEIAFCGVCHSDIHQVRDEWGGAKYPMVPGHEMVGKVTQVGKEVSKFKVGDFAGVGCFVDSCRVCPSCKEGVEQYCDGHIAFSYNSTERDQKTPTYGGYSSQIVVDQNYTLKLSPKLDLASAAPLLCAGITTYSPLRHFRVGKMHKVGVIGLGGLGHMAVKFAASFGADVTVFSTSRSKEKDAARLGAKHFIATKEEGALTKAANQFDFLINTVSAPHDINAYIDTLKRDGTMIVVGVPPESTQLHAHSMIVKRRRISGSLIGGIKETQEMLDYCAEKNITCDVETIAIDQINLAYDRMVKADVKYRFSIDMKTL